MSGARPRRLACGALTWAVAVSCLGCAPAGALATGSAARAGCDAVHIAPSLTPGQPPASYFTLSVEPGRTARLAVTVTNTARSSCAVVVSPAYGQTAVNSGDTYPITGPGRCAATSCWLSGLPARVLVPGHGRVIVPFTVTVPTGAQAGEHLAGVVASPARAPAPVRHPRGTTALVIAQIAIGVAITVPGPLRPQLTIAAAHFTDRTRPVVEVTVVDRGNTWEHPRGRLELRIGSTVRSLPFRSATILPGNRATIPVDLSSIRAGSWPTTIELHYDQPSRPPVLWRRTLVYGAVRPAAAGAAPAGALRGAHSGWSTMLVSALVALSLILACATVLQLSILRRPSR